MNLSQINSRVVFSTILGGVASIGLILSTSCTGGSANAKPNFVFKDAPNPEAVAKVGDKVLSMDDLVGDKKLEYIEIKKREYDFKMERLNDYLKSALLSKEAADAKMDVETFLNQKVIRGNIKISDKDFKKFVEEKRIPDKQITPDIKDRITKYLEDQKKDEQVQEYLAKLTKKNPVEVYFKKPKLSVNVEVGAAPVTGGKNAPVTIVEFSDFQCPFCSKAAATINEVKKKYGSKVKLAFKHFPLSFHKEAFPAAEASMCVHEQNADKFWKFHDIVFENQKELTPEALEKYATQAGANLEKFKACMSSGKFKQFVQDDLNYGEKIGVRSTPTFFINGEIVSGALPFEQFAEVIDSALEDAKK